MNSSGWWRLAKRVRWRRTDLKQVNADRSVTRECTSNGRERDGAYQIARDNAPDPSASDRLAAAGTPRPQSDCHWRSRALLAALGPKDQRPLMAVREIARALRPPLG